MRRNALPGLPLDAHQVACALGLIATREAVCSGRSGRPPPGAPGAVPVPCGAPHGTLRAGPDSGMLVDSRGAGRTGRLSGSEPMMKQSDEAIGCATPPSEIEPPPRPSTPSAAVAASDLCRMCGLCCDGTLFGYVPITNDESVRLLRRLPILAPSSRLGLRVEQRCVALGPRGCDVYADRPAACARFICKLLARVTAGELDASDAHAMLASILVVVDRLDGALPPGTHLHNRRHLLAQVSERTTPELAAILSETWSDLATFDSLAAEHLFDSRSPEGHVRLPAAPKSARASGPPRRGA